MQLITRFGHHQRGIAMIEFALVFPFLLVLLFGALELTRYILIIQKLEKASYVLTDAVGQLDAATTAHNGGEIDLASVRGIIDTFDTMMTPFNDPAVEGVIFSSVVNQRNRIKSIIPPTLFPQGLFIRWVQFRGGNIVGTPFTVLANDDTPWNALRTSAGTCRPATFPANAAVRGLLTPVTMQPNENVIIGEFYYRYTPLYEQLLHGVSSSTNMTSDFALAPRQLVRRIFLHPRNGDLVDLPNPPAQPLTVANSPCT